MEKKLIFHSFWLRKKIIVIPLAMKLLTALMFAGSMAFSASTYSQRAKIDLKIENSSLTEILNSIEKSSEFIFIYNANVVNSGLKRSISVKDESIDVVLNILLQATDISYRIDDRQVFLYKNDELKVPESVNSGNNVQQRQKKEVSGTVKDSKGIPLPGVSIVVKGTTLGTITDAEGKFMMSIPTDSKILAFSFVGMKTQEIVIGNNLTFSVTLAEEIVGINDVVVVGYGTQKKQTVTGSIADVKGEELVTAPMANVTNTLAGRLPGLISQQTNGRPGADAAAISIRGFGSALIIVDGAEADIATIDANEIESVTILKDGAASIYGARAGNGVILVTTKRGINEKPVITLNSSETFQGLTDFPKQASSGQYTTMTSEAWLQSGKPAETVPYTQDQIQKYYQGNDPLYPNTNWFNVLTRKWAPLQQHNLSVRGGSDKIKYYGFLGYMDQESLWKENGGDYRRYNLQSNIDAKITDQLTFQLDLASTIEARRFPYGTQDPAAGSLWTHLWSDLPIYPSSFPDPTRMPFTGINGETNILSNSSLIGVSNSDHQNIKGTISLNYNFKAIKGLSAKIWYNYNQDYSSDHVFVKPVPYYNYDPASKIYTLAGTIGGTQAQLNQDSNGSKNTTEQLSVNYTHLFAEEHKINLLFLYEAIDYSTNTLSAARINFLSSSIQQLFGGSTTGMSNYGSATEMGRESYIGRFNYSFKNKYLLESSFRSDASAKFPANKRWGYFPSVSLGWIASQEGFMQRIKKLDNLKIRASYGESGNDGVGDFQYLSGYAYGLNYILGPSPQQGLVSTGLANPDLTWERVKIYNCGADFSFWNRKLYGEIDAFYRERNGIPATKITSLPSTFGASLPPENINSLNDRGFEFKAGTTGNFNKVIYWDVNANISWSRAKWNHFEEPVYTDPDQKRIYQQSGRWVDRYFGYKSEGLFTSQQQINNLTYDEDGQGNTTLRPGDIIYKDVNGDGKIDWKDQIQIGKGFTPHWMFGFNINLKYKNFDLATLFQGAFGYCTNVVIPMNSQEFFNNRWTTTNNNPNALEPRLGGAATDGYTSDYYVKKAGYIRLKTLSVGYNLPSRLLEKFKFKQIRIYAAGSNLITFDRLKKYGIDPETPYGNAGLYYPQQRTVSLGVNVSL